MENEEYLDIEDGLSVGAMKYVDPNEIITEEEYNYIKNKVPELNGRVGDIEDDIEEINSSLDNMANKDDVAKISSGTPLFATSTVGMTDITKNYVNTTDGYLYIYSGGAWTKTGILYQSTGLNDSSVMPLKLYRGTVDSNLFNKNTTKDGYYLDNSGNEVQLSSYCISDYIDVEEGVIYTFYAVDNIDGIISFVGCLYNSNKQFVSKITGNGATGINNITIPSGVKYVKINTGKNKKDVTYFKKVGSIENVYSLEWLLLKSKNIGEKIVEKKHLSDEVMTLIGSSGVTVNKWKGKTANFLGDSITYGYGLNDYLNERYTSIIASSLEMTVNNYGISGTKIATTTNDYNGSFTKRYLNMVDADIVFVFGGTNDYGHATINSNPTAPFGTFADKTDVSFYGALHVLYKGLVEKYLGKQIVVITPIHRTALVNAGGGDDLVVNPDTNKNLMDYVSAEREVAKYYGIKVLDLYSELSLNPIITSIKTAYMPDGLHPNAEGHKLIAKKIISFMNTL